MDNNIKGNGYSRYMEYESPFLDMTSAFLPRRIKSLLNLIAATVLSDSLVSQCIRKGAEYPITDLIYNGNNKSALKDNSIEKKWKSILEEQLDIIRSLKQSNMNEIGYGNSIVSINFPFKRFLICPRCKRRHAVESIKTKFRSFKYYGKCKAKGCRYNGAFVVKDIDTKDIKKLSFVHWDLLHLDIKFNNITSDHFYYYSPPLHLINSVRMGDLDIVNGLRWEIIDSISRITKQIKLSEDNVFHFKREGLQYLIPSERGWGIPAPMAVLKDIFHCRLLKKGNEMIAFEHIVPLRILYPESNGNESPHDILNMPEWKAAVDEEVRLHKADPNRVSILPVPLGIINMGGDAKSLLITQELKLVEEDIITGMGFAPEIIKGGASWSGSAVSLRVVENTFINTRNEDQNFIEWVIDKIARYFKIKKIEVKMSNFKMADDIQQKKLVLDMASGEDPMISRNTAITELGFDSNIEYEKKMIEIKKSMELLKERVISNIEAQGEATIVQSIFQADADTALKNRTEYNLRKEQQDKMEYEFGEDQQKAVEISKEISDIAKAYGLHPQQISVKKMLVEYTKQFYNLLNNDPKEFAWKMLAMKNDMPYTYAEIYNNLREINVINADLTPNLQTVQEQTPGEIPQNVQGEINAETPPSAAETGIADEIKNLPEQRPPNREGGSPM